MVATFDNIRLIGPPAADGEYVALDEHEIVHLHDYPRIYAVPGLYADYLVGDLGSPSGTLRARLRGCAPGGLISAGAFGGTHAPPAALINALSVLPVGAPVAITIDERWMDSSDPDGFGAAVE